MSYRPLSGPAADAKPATEATRRHNQGVAGSLPFTDRRSFDNAARGFIASLEPLTIERSRPDLPPAYDLEPMSFLQDEAPDEVNPSLWRQAQLNAQHHGLFEITDGLYQVRSFDIANMTLIRGNAGWVIVDPLTSAEAAQAALALANKHLGERTVVAIVITHSHVDHYAGILGVTSVEAVRSSQVSIIAPEHFTNEALSENVLAGNVMGRRATYMYGNLLPPGSQGFVTTGLGAALSMGTTGFLPPTDTIKQTGEHRTLDGVDFEFQMTPGTEAPAEFVFYLPGFKALCMAEITSHHMHNVYTLRGAQVRDALAWSQQINESIERYGDQLEIQFGSHHWPIWGRTEAVEYLEQQRDLYKFIHDQSLRLANHGLTKDEVAEQLALPAELDQEFSNRGYYGSLHHNARAVYVKYLGYFDGNPASLHRLPPSEAASRYINYMGGADQMVARAEEDFAAGDYRWVAEVLNHVMMADPEHERARALLADCLEQLGYQAESAPWRNFYLSGALELRQGLPPGSVFRANEGMAQGMPIDNVFALMAVRLLPQQTAALKLQLNLEFSDLSTTYLLSIERCVLHAFPHRRSEHPNTTLQITTHQFKRWVLNLTDAASLVESGEMQASGDLTWLERLPTLFDDFPRRFPIVTRREVDEA